METEKSWLLLTQFSQKYHVSISTLRRRIRTEKIKYQVIDGKYYVEDEPPLGTFHKAADETTAHTMTGLSELLAFCQGLIQSKEKMFEEMLKDKMTEVNSLKERVAEQKMLIRILEEKLRQESISASSLDV